MLDQASPDKRPVAGTQGRPRRGGGGGAASAAAAAAAPPRGSDLAVGLYQEHAAAAAAAAAVAFLPAGARTIPHPNHTDAAAGACALGGPLYGTSQMMQAGVGGGGGVWVGDPPPPLASPTGPPLGIMNYPGGWSGFAAFAPFGAEFAAGFVGNGLSPAVPLPSDGWWPPFPAWQQPGDPFSPAAGSYTFPPIAGFPAPAIASPTRDDEPAPPRAPRAMLARLPLSSPPPVAPRSHLESSGRSPTPRRIVPPPQVRLSRSSPGYRHYREKSAYRGRLSPQARAPEYDRWSCRDRARSHRRYEHGPSGRRHSPARTASSDRRGRRDDRQMGTTEPADPRWPRDCSVDPERQDSESTHVAPFPQKLASAIPGRQCPSDSYITQASREPRELSRPKRKLCLLGLNGTLIFQKRSAEKGELLDWYLRPNLGDFIEYLFKNFEVMVWSSATERNVRRMIDIAFPSWAIKRLLAVWNRSSCDVPEDLYARKVVTIKDLRAVWDKVPYPGRTSAAWDQSNTILIDDSVEKAVLQPYNCLLLKPFDFTFGTAGVDRELKNVRKYLDILLLQRDVSAYMRHHPYVITEEVSCSRALLGAESYGSEMGHDSDVPVSARHPAGAGAGGRCAREQEIGRQALPPETPSATERDAENVRDVDRKRSSRGQSEATHGEPGARRESDAARTFWRRENERSAAAGLPAAADRCVAGGPERVSRKPERAPPSRSSTNCESDESESEIITYEVERCMRQTDMIIGEDFIPF